MATVQRSLTYLLLGPHTILIIVLTQHSPTVTAPSPALSKACRRLMQKKHTEHFFIATIWINFIVALFWSFSVWSAPRTCTQGWKDKAGRNGRFVSLASQPCASPKRGSLATCLPLTTSCGGLRTPNGFPSPDMIKMFVRWKCTPQGLGTVTRRGGAGRCARRLCMASRHLHKAEPPLAYCWWSGSSYLYGIPLFRCCCTWF